MSIPRTSAHRLATIMSNVMAQPGNQAVVVTLKNVLGCRNDSEFYPLYGELRELPEKIELLVRQHISEEYHSYEDLLSWRPQIDAALNATLSLAGPTHSITNHYGPQDIKELRIVGGLLGEAQVEGRVDPDTLAELRASVEELHNQVQSNPEVPSDLRTFICDQLDTIRRALREFTIRGPESLNDAVTEVAGAIVRNRHLFDDANEASRSAWDGLRRTFDLAEQCGNAMQALGTGVIQVTTAAAVVWGVLHGAVPQLQLPPAPADITVIDAVDPGLREVPGAEAHR
ncbi:hypothetical protein ACWF9G_08825 [Nocardia sp. NPDC055029]